MYRKVAPGLSSSPFAVNATPAEIIKAAFPAATAQSIHRAGNSHPGLHLHIPGFNDLDIALFRAVDHGVGQRMLRALFQRRGNAQQLFLIYVGCTSYCNDGRLAMRQSPGFIECDGIVLASRSMASPPLNRMPSCAPRPTATVSAAGTASPIAHGQAITSTAIDIAKALLIPSADQKQPTR